MEIRTTDIFNFIVTSKEKTFTQASINLGITQPALSESIKRLESDLGYILFYRSRSGIALTPEGRVFLDKAEIFSSSFENLKYVKNRDEIFGKKQISIGAHTTVSQYTLPLAFKWLNDKAPDYKFKIHHGLSREIQQQVQSGTIDIAVVVNPINVPDLIINEVSVDQVAIWKSPNVVKTDILYCNPALSQTQTILNKSKLKFKQVIETSSLELISTMVANGLGVGILPEKVVNLNHTSLVILEKSPIVQDKISIIYRPEFGKNPAERLTIEALKKPFEITRKKYKQK